jgi:hypothetical protein
MRSERTIKKKSAKRRLAVGGVLLTAMVAAGGVAGASNVRFSD